MGRDRSFPEVIRRDGGEAPFAADEVIYERDPLGEGKEARAIDEVIHGEPAPSEETS
ncbi:hypothetical protein SAMN04488025_10945 [Planifilum fulgidum]|jgi:hypothetical protein|uniref:Uncharacterized protein n=1 Tax=Planifilum fulgidum TaxID=201973 RepID=A0A1I2MQK6_9BACL|nr:hypothetical protein [Planifilum fulgidum]SFF93408.1 hypothetical protein SAMN04488025_10945 [Planifilum fulgidum]